MSRDRQIETLKFAKGELKEDCDRGSGYPSDPITKEWLSKNCDSFWGLPQCTRFSWRPVKDALAERCIEVDYGVIDDEDEEDAILERKATGGGMPFQKSVVF